MRAISLWQPWATLLVTGIKKIETRHWSTKYRGPLMIHASQTKKGMSSVLEIKRTLDTHAFYKDAFPKDFDFGGYVGIVDLVDCVPTVLLNRHGAISDPIIERAVGNFQDGRYGWLTLHRQAFKNIVPAKGKQGFWTLSDTELASIQEMGNR